jgi:hypothetical protein
MRILPLHKDKIKRHIENRHYYLRMAKIAIMLKHAGDVQMFCHLAEVEQQELDQLEKWYPFFKFA